MMGVFSRDIYPGTRAEPRVPPEVYKIISDAIQAAQLGGQDPAAAADGGLRPARRVPRRLQRRADPLTGMILGRSDRPGRTRRAHFRAP